MGGWDVPFGQGGVPEDEEEVETQGEEGHPGVIDNEPKDLLGIVVLLPVHVKGGKLGEALENLYGGGGWVGVDGWMMRGHGQGNEWVGH